MALSLDQEYRAKARRFLGYFNLEARAGVDAGGIPMIIPNQGILENNMRLILDQYSLDMITALIDQIECYRCKIQSASTRLSASEVAGTVKLNPYEINQLWGEDLKLCLQLAQLLASPLYWHPTGAGVGYPGGIYANAMNAGGSIKWAD